MFGRKKKHTCKEWRNLAGQTPEQAIQYWVDLEQQSRENRREWVEKTFAVQEELEAEKAVTAGLRAQLRAAGLEEQLVPVDMRVFHKGMPVTVAVSNGVVTYVDENKWKPILVTLENGETHSFHPEELLVREDEDADEDGVDNE